MTFCFLSAKPKRLNLELEVDMVLLSLILHGIHSVDRQPDQNMMQVCVCMVLEDLGQGRGRDGAVSEDYLNKSNYFDKLQATKC